MTEVIQKEDNPYRELASGLARHLCGVEKRVAKQDPTARALLAQLRDGGRRRPGDHVTTWALVSGIVPDQLAGRAGHASRTERSVFRAVTLHALHAQGGRAAHDSDVSVGRALRRLITAEGGRESVRRRVHAAVGSGSTPELERHMTSLVTMMRRNNIAMDYLDLQRGLAMWDNPISRTKTRLRWGRALAFIDTDNLSDHKETDSTTEKITQE